MTPNLLDRLSSLIGQRHVLCDPEDMAAYAFDWRRIEPSRPDAVLLPGSTTEVAGIVALCAEAGVGLIPQGGNTGLVGGTVAAPGRLLLNLSRLNRIRDLDALDYTVTVEAGCILADLQSAAAAADRLFPLSLGAEGTCTIGGNLSTNAGGILTIRYGNARDLVLGLEVVLPDGQIWNGLRRLRKDNTGYDLKQLFLGAEGTLGVITAATLKLFPRPRQTETALLALPSADAAVAMLALLRDGTGDALTACELLPRFGFDAGALLLDDRFDPFAAPAPWYLLIELTAGRAGPELRQMTEQVLAAGAERSLLLDAVFADSEERRHRLWRLRENLPEIGRRIGGAVHHDISVPVSQVPALLSRAAAALAELLPGIRPYPFGHVADGNIHYNVARPVDWTGEAFLARSADITACVHRIVGELGGSISAEHGIGGRKRAELARTKPELDIQLMRRIKQLFDPADIMNPGKLLPD